MREHRVEQDVDVFEARRAAKEFAQALGFPRVDCLEIAIAASELASNIVKYGIRGRLRLERVVDPARGEGLRLTAFDDGPPFTDFAMAQRDGCDDAGLIDPLALPNRRGIGAGLGAVRRFSDEMGWAPAEGGKRIWAVRYLARAR